MSAAFVPPARLVSRRAHMIPGQLHVTELFFEVPISYAAPTAGTLKLFARSVRKHVPSVASMANQNLEEEHVDKPYLVYLEGGPGFGNPEPQEHALTRSMLDRGYQMLLLDYRGTGYSTPVNARALGKLGGAQVQADYLKLFRADTIVRDLEAVRLCLTANFPDERKKWSVFGQSFGGFVSLTYLSKFPNGLREVFMTGGLAPIKRTPDEVYRALYRKVIARNMAYYNKFPEDNENVKRIARHICFEVPEGIQLPGGGKLTIGRLRGLGLAFGGHGGLDSVHAVILKMVTDLDQFGFLTRATLMTFEQQVPFDSNPIYAILHESIYCYRSGIASRWAAARVGAGFVEFCARPGEFMDYMGEMKEMNKKLDAKLRNPDPLFFFGEMVRPSTVRDHPEVEEMDLVALILADYDKWDDLYDEEQLRKNTVPVYAVSYIDDMYVDIGFARETASIVKGIKVHETNSLYHNAVRARTDEVIGHLFRMRDDTID
ncbi:Alpha/Beta hydrolase protein [Diplogelasinospora grovesii]|uniref:Alpha/Beta hydrolase protein n=1 Tax=Diplogelasinospora grovesii TaxID=303347 RepID=A0AAN6S690_9PEZI|nr:Alpha/Beta hydrolase protein [Diplogelasinospora grovesii]